MMRMFRQVILTGLIALAMLGGYGWMARMPSHGPVEVAPGVVVSVEPMASDATGYGRIYLARVTLDAALVDLFITPPVSETVPTHRLAHTRTVALREKLLVTVNASMFSGGSWPLRRAGQPATPMETTVIHGKPINLWEHTYMMGFGPDLAAEPVRNKPPPLAELGRWKWGFGAQSWQLYEGKPGWAPDHGKLYKRTAIGLDAQRKTLYLAVLDHATHGRVAREMKARGAEYAMSVDGSESSTFVVNGVPWTGDWRPVANHYGIRNTNAGR